MAYIAEKQGDIKHLIDAFTAIRGYMDDLIPAVGAFSAMDAMESIGTWFTHAFAAGQELAHLYPFRARLLRAYKQAEVTTLQDLSERLRQWPTMQGYIKGGFVKSEDGLVGDHHVALTR